MLVNTGAAVLASALSGAPMRAKPVAVNAAAEMRTGIRRARTEAPVLDRWGVTLINARGTVSSRGLSELPDPVRTRSTPGQRVDHAGPNAPVEPTGTPTVGMPRLTPGVVGVRPASVASPARVRRWDSSAPSARR